MKRMSLPILITVLVFGLALVQLVVTHQLSNAGESIKELEIKALRIGDKNEVVRQEINQLGSLRRISQEAEKLGLIQSQSFFHLTPEIPVAMYH